MCSAYRLFFFKHNRMSPCFIKDNEQCHLAMIMEYIFQQLRKTPPLIIWSVIIKQ